MDKAATYDIGIIGGGLAGLASSIQLSKAGHKVVLFEKEQYPFHKVCGEYISMESWDFIESLGLPLSTMQLPVIKKLKVSSPGGAILEQVLPLGGFGISRFTLDNALKKIALDNGVNINENCKVNDVVLQGEQFFLDTQNGTFICKVCCGSFGKRSNLDIKWKRRFAAFSNNRLSNYIGVKYHIKTTAATDTISLHNFENGYCGMSQIENGLYCLCYLTTAANLKKEASSIAQMERNILYKNMHLKQVFENCEMVYKSPLTISQISFSKKKQVYNHVLLLGDAAGMITPLCGNGMSMALHSSKIAAGCIQQFLTGTLSRAEMEENYTKKWRSQFEKRVFAGRLIQRFFGKPVVTNLFIAVMKRFPGFTSWLIRLTHGEKF